MGTGSFPEIKSGRGVTLIPHPLLVPWSRKGRAIPLLPLWAVRPVQSLSACTRVHFTFTLTSRRYSTFCSNHFVWICRLKEFFSSFFLRKPKHLCRILSSLINIQTLWSYTPYNTVHIHLTTLCIYTLQHCAYAPYNTVHIHLTTLCIYTLQYCAYTPYNTVHIHLTTLCIYTLQHCAYTPYNTVHIHLTTLCIYTLQHCAYTPYNTVHIISGLILRCVQLNFAKCLITSLLTGSFHFNF